MIYNRIKLFVVLMLLGILSSMPVFAEETVDGMIEQSFEESMNVMEETKESIDEIPVEVVGVEETESIDVFKEDVHYINSFYDMTISETELLVAPAPASSEIYCTSWNEVVSVVRDMMVSRETTVFLNYESTESLATGWLKNLLNDVMVETDDFAEGDYLKSHFAGCKSSRKTTQREGKFYNSISLTFTYYTTKEQENVVTSQVQSILNGFNFTSKTSDYQKVKTIYDWICSNVSYDYTNLNNDSYKLKYSAYAAVFNRTSVCQGYAGLAYRLLRESGINTRIITGTSLGERHAWLIVQLNGLYYNLDPTWDAGSSTYKYFLKGENTFVKHTRAAEFTTDAFYKEYPMGNEDYVYKEGSGNNNQQGNQSSIETPMNPNVNCMYRLYNPNSGEHFYTANISERDHLDGVGWVYEGIGWYAPKTGDPVYRLYNPNAGDHHYTLNLGEKDHLVSVGWNYEGIGWYSDPNKAVPLHRLYNPNAVAGSHHYTTNYNEAESLRKIGWIYENIGWYGVNP